MARAFTKLLPSITSDDDFLAGSLEAKFLYVMVLAMPKLSPAGCIDYRPARWQKLDADIDIDATVGELVERGYLLFDADTEEVLVRSWIKIDGGYRNRNMVKSVRSAIGLIESKRLQRAALAALNAALADDTDSPPEGGSEGDHEGATEPNSSSNGNFQRDASNQQPQPDDADAAADVEDEFDQAVSAALQVRFEQSVVTNRKRWEPAARNGIITDYGHRIRRLLDQGHTPANAGLIAIGRRADFTPSRFVAPKVDDSHPSTCVCDGSGWVYPDLDTMVRQACTAVQVVASVHPIRNEEAS